MPIGEGLYALGEREVTALDISDRDAPRVVASIDLGGDVGATAASAEAPRCTFISGTNGEDMGFTEGGMYACRMTPGRRSAGQIPFVFALMLFGLGWARRRARRTGPRLAPS